MSDGQDMSLDVEITGNSGGAQDAMLGFVSSIDRVPQSVNVSQASLDRLSTALDGIVKQHGLLADASDKTKTKVDDVTKSTTEGSKAAGEFNSVGGDMARMMSSLGVESGAAAGRIGAFAGALGSLKTAAPEIIAIIAAATSAIAGFEIGKEAIKSASDLQDSMTRLGQVVKDQGGNWGMLSRQVKEFADAQVASTTYTDTAVINSIERLVASGMSLKDSMTSTRIAEDLAAGSGRSLEEATNSLVEATHGRLMGLEAMGVLTKEQVKDGQTYDQVLQQIEDHMGGAALSATQTYTGALSSLGAEWTKLLEDAGTPFLGLLTTIVGGVTKVVDSLDTYLQPAFVAISAWAKNESPAILEFFTKFVDSAQTTADEISTRMGPAIDAVSHGVSDLGAALAPFLTDKLQGVDDVLLDGQKGWDAYDLAVDRTVGTVSGLVKILGEAVQAVADLINTGSQLGDWVNQQIAKMGPLGNAIARAEDPAAFAQPNETSGAMPAQGHYGGIDPAGYRNPLDTSGQPSTKTGYNPMLGGPQGKKKAASSIFEGADVVADFHEQDDAIKELLATVAELPKTYDGYEQSLRELAPAIQQENEAHAALGVALMGADEKLQQAADKFNAYNELLQGKHPSAAQTAELTKLKQAFDDAQKSVTNLSSAYSKSGQDIEQLSRAYATAKAAIDQMKTAFDTFANSAINKTNEEYLTFTMTNQQKLAFYQDIMNRMTGLDKASIATRESAETSYLQSWLAMERERYQAEVNFEGQSQSKMASFLDSIVVEHKSMADSLKNVYQDIEKYFIDMLAQMMAKAMAALPLLQAILGFGGGGGALDFSMLGPGLGSGPGAIPGFGSNAAAATGGGGSSTLGAAISRAMSPSGGGGSVGSGSYGFGGGAGGGYGGGGGGGSMSPDFSMSGGGLGPSSGGAASASGGASGGGYGSSGYHFGPGGGGGSPAMTGLAAVLARSGLGSILGVAGGGAMVGGLAFGGKGYSALGGALGGAGILGLEALFGGTSLAGALPALLASGPLGWGVLAGSILLGAFVSSMFGDHFNPANEPDQGPTQDAWGIANADMQGMTSANPMNAGGKQYVMDGQTSSATGGKGWNLLMEQFVSKFRGSQSALPSDLQGVFPQIEQLWGGATDKQFFNPDGKDGYLDIGSGKRALWSDFWGVVQQHGQEISQLMQTFTPTDIYLSSLSGGMRSGGSSTPSPGGGGFNSPFALQSPGGGGNSNAIASGGPGRLAGSLAQRLSQSVAIHINVRNSSTLADTATLERGLRDAFGTALPSLLEDLNVR